MGRIKFWTPSGSPAAIYGTRSRFALFLLFFACGLWPMASNLYSQTELGSQDDLTVLGADGTAGDPDTEIKGFTVFGSTQAAYTGAVVGPGNVVVNGALAVSSGAYFVGNSTFTLANKIFINDGSAGQLLQRSALGNLVWISSSAIGDNLGSHVATTTLNMAAFNIVGVSTISVSSITTAGAGVIFSTNAYFMNGNVGIGTATPWAKLDVAGNIQLTNVGDPYREIRLNTDSGAFYLTGATDYTRGASMQFYGESHPEYPGSFYIVSGGQTVSPDSVIEFGYRNVASGYNPKMTIKSTGNVGIGVTNPTNKLELATAGGSSMQFDTSIAGKVTLKMNGVAVAEMTP